MVNIGLIGTGTIGSGVIKILNKNSDLIKNRTGIDINIKKVCDIKLKNVRKLGIEKEKLTTDFNDVIKDKEIDIVIELIGGYEPARTVILKAMKKGKHIVTANKALIAKHGVELFKEAEKNKVNFKFEGSVGGCIPILRSLQQSYIAERIESIYGILNGTTNYILTRMSEGMGYEKALKKAQKLGFAEKDPSFDVEGKDAAQKLVILASLAFNAKIKDDIFTWGITKISKDDLKFAAELGYTIKLLAIAKKNKELELRVHPTMIPKEHELANVKNELNAIYIVGENINKVMLYGKGAGQMPTASVVIGDVIDIAKKIQKNLVIAPLKYFDDIKIKKIEDIGSRYYLRYSAVNKPSVLAKISAILGKNNISIAGVWQKEEKKPVVPVIMATHKALEKDLMKAVKQIDRLDVIKDKTVVIRIEDIK